MQCTLHGALTTTGIKKIRDRNVYMTDVKKSIFLPFCLRILFRLSEMFVYFANALYRIGKR